VCWVCCVCWVLGVLSVLRVLGVLLVLRVLHVGVFVQTHTKALCSRLIHSILLLGSGYDHSCDGTLLIHTHTLFPSHFNFARDTGLFGLFFFF
jgi:hypothetical protein